MTRAVALASLFAVAACSSPAGRDAGTGGSGGFQPACSVLPEGGGAVAVVGTTAAIELALGITCLGFGATIDDLPRADLVTVEVLDPDNRLMPGTVGDPIVVDSTDLKRRRLSAVVRFTPGRVGLWTVAARFEPGAGMVQLQVAVVAPSRDAGFRVVPVEGLPGDCGQFGLLASGTAVCRLRDRDGFLAVGVDRFSGSAFAIDGDAIWMVRDASVVRYVPDAGFTHRAAPFTSNARLAVRSGEALVLDWVGTASVLSALSVDADGGLRVVERPIVGFPLGLAATAERILVHTSSSGVGRDLVLEEDGGITAFTAPAAGGFLGVDEGVFWSEGGADGIGPHTLEVVDLDGARPRRRSLALRAEPSPLARLSPAIPVVHFVSTDGQPGPIGVLRVDGAELSWDLYDPGPGFGPVTSATRRHAFARSLDGKTLKVFDR